MGIYTKKYDFTNKKAMFKNNGGLVTHGELKLEWVGPIWPWASKILMG